MLSIGQQVEIKGFGKWTGCTLIGDIIQHYEGQFYVVRLWTLVDPEGSYVQTDSPPDDSYYLRKQEQYQVVHQRFVREAEGPEDGLYYNVGDIVDCEELSCMSRGVIINKVIQSHGRDVDPNEMYTYIIRLDGSDRTAHVHYYNIRPHMPWP